MVNTELLRSRIRESGFRINFIAGKVGVSYQGFLNKINNLSDFKSEEILSLQKILDLTAEERDRIFFDSKVD